MPKHPLSTHWKLAHVSSQTTEANPEPHPRLLALGAISIDDVRADNQSVQRYRNAVQLAQSVWLNLEDFTRSVVAYGAQFLERRSFGPDELDVIALNFSRQLLNVLSMFRSFLDHSDTSLARRFGGDSTQWLGWKRVQASQYDSSFSYRLMYKLRNFCQHVGVPPLSISFSAGAETDAISFRLDLSREQLLQEKTVWNHRLQEDLGACPEAIPIFEHLDAWSIAFGTIAKFLLKVERDAARDAAKRILSRRAEFKVPEHEGEICAVWFEGETDDGQALNCEMEGISERWAREVLSGRISEGPNK